MSQVVKTKNKLNKQEKSVPSLSSRLSLLAKRLAESDRDAYRELFEETHMIMIRYCWRFTKDEDASRDIVQDVFVKVWDIRKTLDSNRSVLALLYTMVRNRALNVARDTHYSDGVDADEIVFEDIPSPDEEVHHGMLKSQVHEWIKSLPPRRRQAFKLSRFEGLTHAEIASIMNLTPRTVNTHVMLALRDLRAKLHALQKDQRLHEHRS